MHVFTYVLLSQLRKQLMCVACIHPLVLHGQMGCIAAATKLVWTAVILNEVKLVDHLQSVAHLMYTAGRCRKYFEAKGGFERTCSNPPPPPAYGLYCFLKCMNQEQL